MTAKLKVLMIFISEAERVEDLPLYEVIIRKLVQLNVNGATVSAGIMGFGKHHHVHRKRLFGVNDDRPVTITVVESEEKLQAVIPIVRPMVKDGLVIVFDAEQVL